MDHDFCHLHFHTCYSLLDGATRIKDAVGRAASDGMKALAITDHGVMHGAVEFYKECKSKGIKPIIGCEVYTCDAMLEKKLQEDGSQSNHLVLLATNEVGYHNLSRIVSAAQLKGFYYKPRVDHEFIAQHSEGLIGLSACLKGEVTERMARGQYEEAAKRAGIYEDILGKGNFYLELQDHGIAEQRIANQGLIELARKNNMPLIASNDVHYLTRDHAEAHDVLLCLQTNAKLSDPKRLKYHADQFYMKSRQEMWKMFGHLPNALSNTVQIAERCNLTMKLGNDAGLHFPDYITPEGHTHKSYLIKVATENLQSLYDIPDLEHPRDDRERTVRDRFLHELSIIEKTNYINYFLVVWDFVHYAKRQKIPVGPGRGSGAGSLVAYALGITAIDPLRYNLIFERFLNPDRVSPPDFDIDFCQTRRGEVIEYVKHKYGHENCAQIITFGSLGAKTVIRDIGRVLEIDLSKCDKLAKLIPESPDMTLEKAEKENPDFKAIIATDPDAQRIMRYARVLEGLPRNQGTHAAGVVIGEVPLRDLIPLCRDKNNEAVTQYEMKPLELTGLLKMDFLGLKTLTVIQETVEHIQREYGKDIELERMTFDDPAAFDLLCRGDTVGVFQVESKGMREMLRQFQPRLFEDVIALIALYRPGPMDMIPDFIKRAHGDIKVEYPHPLLEKVLGETYGVFVYQEQVQQAANVLAGFTLAQGDLLRRAMGKKDADIMNEQRQKFVDGCRKTNNIPPNKAGEIFDTIDKFASYGFNKSHSAAYAVITYRTAYLKAHYPLAFWSALMSSEMGNSDKLPFFIAEARSVGIKVLPPDAQQSLERFRPVGDAIRFGMGGIKNVGLGAVESIVREREKNGPFTSFMDFVIRVDSSQVNRKALESLIKSGAFDWTGLSRARLFGGIEHALQRRAAHQRDHAHGQITMFDMLMGDGGGSGDSETPQWRDDEIPECDSWPENEMLAYEKELIGFFITGHPLNRFRWELENFAQCRIDQLTEKQPGEIVRVGGLAADIRKMFTKKDRTPMAAFRLDGIRGSIDAVVFPSAYATCQHVLTADAPILVTGNLSRDDEQKIMVTEIQPLGEAGNHYAEIFTVSIPEEAITEELIIKMRDVLETHPGKTGVRLVLRYPMGVRVRISPHSRFEVHPCGRLVADLAMLHEGITAKAIAKPPVAPSRGGRGSFRQG